MGATNAGVEDGERSLVHASIKTPLNLEQLGKPALGRSSAEMKVFS